MNSEFNIDSIFFALMSLHKKRKIPGLSGKELAAAYASLHNFRSTITTEESEKGDLNETSDVGLLNEVLSQFL